MRIASLQRLLAWPAVCRSLLCEKDEDNSLPAGRWDQRGSGGAVGGSGCARLNGRGRFRPSHGAGVSVGARGASDRSSSSSPFSSRSSVEVQSSSARGPSGREARLTPEQRQALRLLCGNLAAFPVMQQRPGSGDPGAGGGGGGGGDGSRGGGASSGRGASSTTAAPAGTPASCFPHHHHTVSNPAIPYGMGRVELPSRDSWRNPRIGGGVAGGGAQGGGGGGAAAGGGGAPGDYGGWNWLDFPGIIPGSQHGGGGATLHNTQPACGMGGLCWPTLYDLTMAKRRQRERLRECFRRFSPGQRLDVRDPSGVWMGAVVLWAPGGGSGDEWEDAADGAATAAAAGAHVAGAGGGGAAAAGGGAGAGGGGLGAAAQGAHHEGAADHGTPEWRRLLQLALLADGGHLGMHANQVAAAGAAALAAAVGGGAGDGNGGVADPGAAAVAEAAAAAVDAEVRWSPDALMYFQECLQLYGLVPAK